MNLDFLHMGMAGALEAGLLSLLVGALACALLHWLTRRHGWSHAGQIGWAYVATLVISAGADIWNLLYMGIVPMESPVSIRRVLAGIHDPDTLGIRVICEVAGAALGVMLGWLLASGALRDHLRATRR